jgi:hypothetical protein
VFTVVEYVLAKVSRKVYNYKVLLTGWATCFDWRLVIFRPLQFCYQILCPLWDPIVFTVVEYVLAKVSRKVYDYEELLQTFLETPEL